MTLSPELVQRILVSQGLWSMELEYIDKASPCAYALYHEELRKRLRRTRRILYLNRVEQ
jgi:hypothetical protein